ncbi:hypothetical protein [Nocardioides gansuensis]|uniref:hypothetical protein n=1 Tax=Nocardioides gansuensis TaxID=2138300 RepID=UPI001402A526|nr:hypothetical protein [Nocardioides gansuensis]
MPATIQPRGPLPARVYWTRRVVVLLVPLLLVIGLARLLGGASDASDGSDEGAATAAQAGATTTEVATTASEPVKQGKKKRKARPTAPPTPELAEPSGPCTPSDITVTPAVATATGGADVPITLNLRTVTSPACTWQVSPETVTLKITSGTDRIWASQECPAAIPVQDVVVRQAVDTPVVVTWNARRSDEECSGLTEWALPGYYHVEAAALAGEPTNVQFELVRPSSAVITKTVTPKPQPDGEKGRAHQAGDDGAGVSEPNG